MPTARLTVELPEAAWVGQVSRQHPRASIRVLAAVAEQRDGVVLAELRGDAVDELMNDVRAAADVSDFAVLHRTETEVLAQIETTSAILLDHANRSGVPIEMPFTVRDGETVWDLTAPHDRLSELGEQFTTDGIPFTVNSIDYEVDRGDLLSETQWEVLTAAVGEGYYDTPRTCTQTELAATLDLAKSTCSETLHRAEERIVKQFLEEHPDYVGGLSDERALGTTRRCASPSQAD